MRYGFLMLAALAAAGGVMAQEERILERGKALYGIHCRACHGESGAGDGPTAQYLNVKPFDLRRLAARNAGTFPFSEVYRTIDGRELVRGHGSRAMPIWGLAFQETGRDTNQEDQVRGRILQLIEYLESIQLGLERR